MSGFPGDLAPWHLRSPMPLVFLPAVEAMFLWGDGPPPRVLPTLAHGGTSTHRENTCRHMNHVGV